MCKHPIRSIVVMALVPLSGCGGGGGGGGGADRTICENIAGAWTEQATVTLACNNPDLSGTATGSGTGTIEQTGCRLHYDVAGVPREGTIDGTRVTLTGDAAIPGPGVTLTTNTITIEGTVSAGATRIDATGEGRIAGTLADGTSASCSVRSTSVLTR